MKTPQRMCGFPVEYPLAAVPISPVGLTACSGDNWRDTVQNLPMMLLCHTCGGTDGARHAANDLLRRLSRLRTILSLARSRPQSRARHHAVLDGRAGR